MLNRDTRRALVILEFVISFITPALAQKLSGQLLTRSVSLPAEYASISEHLVTIFKSAAISGGIALVNNDCTPEAKEHFSEFKGSVHDALATLVPLNGGHQLHWREGAGTLVIYNSSGPPPLLTVIVAEFRFSRKEPLSKTSSALLDIPEVANEASKLNIIEYGPELGFAQLPARTTAADTVTVTNVSVLDILNKIAMPHAVWLYKQSQCERNIVSLNWPIR